jgi:hypothetical protein
MVHTRSQPFELHLAANAINVALIRNHSRYVVTSDVAEYMLLIFARRQLLGVVFGLLSRAGSSDEYWTMFMSKAFAEVILRYTTPYTMGRRAHLAARQGYHHVGKAQYTALPLGAHLCYAGALHYLILGSLLVFFSAFLNGKDDFAVSGSKPRPTSLTWNNS